MTASREELQQKLQANRIAVEKLEKHLPVGHVDKNAGVIVWNNLGVIVLCHPRSDWSRSWISIQLYDHESQGNWVVVYSAHASRYTMKRKLKKAQAFAEHIAQRRAAGWKMSRTSLDTKNGLTIINPVNGSTDNYADEQRSYRALKALALNPVDAVLATPDSPALPQALQQAMQDSIASKYKTEVSLLSARHHTMPQETLLDAVQQAQIDNGQSLLVAVEKVYSQAASKALPSASSSS